MILREKSTGKTYKVADNLVNDTLATGNFELRPGVKMPVTLPDGSFGEMDSELLPNAIRDGVRYQTADERRLDTQQTIEQIKKDAYNAPVTAAVVGGLRGATVGLSDVAIRAFGNEDTATALRELQTYNPSATLAGEIVGGVAGMLTPLSPVAAVAKLGAKAAGAAKTAVTGLGAGAALGKMTGAVAGGAAEGALFGVGQTLSEAAMSDPELSMQKAMSNIGIGALLGGSLSGVGRGAIEGARYATDKTLTTLANSKIVPKSLDELAGTLSEVYGTAIDKLRGLDGNPLVKKMFAKDGEEFLRNTLKTMGDDKILVKEATKNFDDIIGFNKELSQLANEQARIQGRMLDNEAAKPVKQVLKELDDEEAIKYGTELLQEGAPINAPKLVQEAQKKGEELFFKTQAAGKKLVNDTDELLASMRKANADKSYTVFDNATIDDMANAADRYSQAVFAAKTPSEVAQAMTTYKNELAPMFKLPQRKSMADLQIENRPLHDTMKQVKDLWGKVRETTTDEKVFGKFGAAMAKRAEAINSSIRSTDEVIDTFYRIKQGEAMNAREYVPDLGKVKSYITNPEAMRNAKRAEALTNVTAKATKAKDALEAVNLAPSENRLSELQKDLAKVERIPANVKGAQAKQVKIEFLQKQIKNVQDDIKAATDFNQRVSAFSQTADQRIGKFSTAFDETAELRAAGLLLNRLQPQTGRSMLGSVIGAAAGGSVGGIPGLLGGILAGATVQNPKSMARYILAMRNAADGFDKMASNAATRFRNLDTKLAIRQGIIPKALPAARQTIIRDRLRIEPGERQQETDEKAFKEHRKKLGALMQDPQALFERIADQVGEEGVTEAPRMTIEAFSAINRGVAFLDSKIPKDPYNADALSSDDFTPSKVELMEYSDYAQAVFKPKTLIKQIETASINPRTVEAIKAVYPKMYNDVLGKVMQSLADSGNKIPYAQRVQLGLLFDIPSTKAMQPDYLARIMSYNTPQEQQQTQPTQQITRSQQIAFRDMKASDRQQRV
jgi:hypothetical protein